MSRSPDIFVTSLPPVVKDVEDRTATGASRAAKGRLNLELLGLGLLGGEIAVIL